MYIYFHGAIFDPSEIAIVTVNNAGLSIQIHGAPLASWISGDREEATAWAAELYQLMLETGIAFQPEDSADAPEELSEELYAALKYLHDNDYEWIARDKDGKIFAFTHKPEKAGAYWEDPIPQTPIKPLPGEVWDELDGSEKPLNIMELLLGP